MSKKDQDQIRRRITDRTSASHLSTNLSICAPQVSCTTAAAPDKNRKLLPLHLACLSRANLFAYPNTVPTLSIKSNLAQPLTRFSKIRLAVVHANTALQIEKNAMRSAQLRYSKMKVQEVSDERDGKTAAKPNAVTRGHETETKRVGARK